MNYSSCGVSVLSGLVALKRSTAVAYLSHIKHNYNMRAINPLICKTNTERYYSERDK